LGQPRLRQSVFLQGGGPDEPGQPMRGLVAMENPAFISAIVHQLVPLFAILFTFGMPVAIIWTVKHFQHKKRELELEAELHGSQPILWNSSNTPAVMTATPMDEARSVLTSGPRPLCRQHSWTSLRPA